MNSALGGQCASEKKSLVFWDFDGVLCDSLLECAAVTLLAAQMIERPDDVWGDDRILALCTETKVAELYLMLSPLRPFVIRGEDYLWQYFHYEHFKPRIGGGMAAYQKAKSGVFAADENARYDEAYYGARRKLAAAFGNGYRGFFRPYAGAIDALRFCLEHHSTYICTNRDQAGVCVLLEDANIALPRSRIYSKDCNGEAANDGRSKTEQVLTLLRMEGSEEIPFVIVEDQVKTPAELSPRCPRMRTIYASYGYGLRNDWVEAKLPSCVQAARADLLLPAIKEMIQT